MKAIVTTISRSMWVLAASPLLARELRVFLRGNKAFIALLVFLLALSGVVISHWTGYVQAWAPDQDITSATRHFFYGIVLGHIVFLTIVTPLLFVPAISLERERDTLPLLLSSPVSTLHIALSKWVAPLLFLILLMTAAVPYLALSFLGGGLSAGDVFKAYTILVGASLMYGSLGLFCSTLRSRVYEVYFIAAVLLLLFAFIIPYHDRIWNYITTLRFQNFANYDHPLKYISPIYSLREIISPIAPQDQSAILVYNPLSNWLGQPRFSINLVALYFWSTAAAFTLLFLGLTVMRLRALAQGREEYRYDDEFEEIEVDEDDDEEEEESSHTIVGYGVISRLALHGGALWRGNPGLMLEGRVQFFARLPVLFRLFYVALIISVLTLPLASFQGAWFFFTLPFAAAAFFTLPLAAASISVDRERGTLDLVRTTMLSSRNIILAKFLVNMQYSLLLALTLYLPGVAVQIIFGQIFGMEVDFAFQFSEAMALLFYPIVLIYALALYTAIGLFFSAWMGRTNQAMISAGVVVFSTLFSPFIIPMELFRGVLGGGAVALGALMISPLSGVAVLFPQGGMNLFERVMPVLNSLGVSPYSFAMLQGVICLMISYAALRFAERALDAC